jgi:hypothetical protein
MAATQSGQSIDRNLHAVKRVSLPCSWVKFSAVVKNALASLTKTKP